MSISKTIHELLKVLETNSELYIENGIFVATKVVNPIVTGDKNLFQLDSTGGPVRIISLSGVVTEEIQIAQTLVSLHVSQFNGDTTIASALDLNNADVYSLLTVPSVLGNTLIRTLAGVAIDDAQDFIIAHGNTNSHIVMNNAQAERIGGITWYCVYQKLSSAAVFGAAL